MQSGTGTFLKGAGALEYALPFPTLLYRVSCVVYPWLELHRFMSVAGTE